MNRAGLVLLACLVMVDFTPLNAQTQKKWPQVAYVIAAGKYTDELVQRLKECCDDPDRVVQAQSGPGCPYGFKQCEVLTLDGAADDYFISNRYSPRDRDHDRVQIMPERYPYGSKDERVRIEAILQTLRWIMTCDNVTYHGGQPNSASKEALCQMCRIYVSSPQGRTK